MESFEDTQRQLRLALIAIGVIIPIGVLGYMVLEDLSFSDAIWITIITLGTIGYGDLVPRSLEGRIFTIILIFGGLGSVAIGAQAAIELLVSPNIRSIRQRRRAERKIRQLNKHFIICGEGELVERTITYILKRVELRLENQREAIAEALDQTLNAYFGGESRGPLAAIREVIRRILLAYRFKRHNAQTILDVMVIITTDEAYARSLATRGILVINDDPTDDRTLRKANITRARAMMIILENDVDALLTVLTARARSSNLYITAATHEDSIGFKITRVGANNVLTPFDVAGQFLNNATLRPAVNAFYNSIIFDQKASEQIVQLHLSEDSAWIGRSLGELNLRERFKTGVIGLRMDYGRFFYAPDDHYVFQQGDIVLAVTPGRFIPQLQADCCPSGSSIPDTPNWQRLPFKHRPIMGEKAHSLIEVDALVDKMQSHYIICGSGPVVHAALDHLNPERPFVVVSMDQRLITDMQKRGFLVIHGDPTQEETLMHAGVDRALAIMVSLDDRGRSVLTTLIARTLNRELLIVATALTDDMIPRLRRAGADRVVTPFRIAAQFVLLATTRPVVSDFLQHVLFNHEAGIETTELYIQDDSPWIGKTIDELDLGNQYRAFVIGIRLPTGRFIYAPPLSYQVNIGEVLIAITPMQHADTIRLIAHGGVSHRPRTLRHSKG
ncbi:MAG: potassium channel family protein [Chloroflexota bacterium]